MQLIDNQLGGTTPMDVIIKLNDVKSNDENDEYEDLLGGEEESPE